MTQYIEHKIGNQSIFEKIITKDDGEIALKRKVFVPLFQQEVDGFNYFVMYDDTGNVLHDIYKYLNVDLKEKPYNSRKKAAFALRLLYCFLSLSNYKIEQINSSVFSELLFFLRGLDFNTQTNPMKTLRSANTVNGYLAVYRSFFKKYDIQCKPLFSATTSYSSSQFLDNSIQTTTYQNNLKTSKIEDNLTPKYISPDDFRSLYRAMLDANDKTAQLICHLMYGYGLRLGEVLGITTEDIAEIRDNGRTIPVIFLRNRMSDKSFQNAKNLMHVINKAQYKTKDYQASRHKIIITYNLYEKLIDYINNQYEYFMEKYPDNYLSSSADIVSVKNIPDFNYYIFLNQYGRVLSAQTWGNHLKKYFELANIPIDKDVKDANLSHRFRHGFAMYHAKFSEHPVDTLTLQKMMRHKSPLSTMVYYNPTPEDEYIMKTNFHADLYNMIPEFEGGLYGTN